MKSKHLLGAFALALALGACEGEPDLNQVAASQMNTPLPAIPAPNNGDWTQVVEQTPEGGFRMGNPDAPVKLIEYASISCPHCGVFSQESSPELKDVYVRSGQVSFEYRPTLLFASDPAIFMLLRCRGPQPFFALTEQLYANQSQWLDQLQAQSQLLQAVPAEQRLSAIVRASGVDQSFRQSGMPQAQIDSCLADRAGVEEAAANWQRVATEAGVTGTPTFFINGNKLEGVDSWNNANASRSLEARLRAAIGTGS